MSWWCPRCKGRKTIREGSFFSKSRFTLQEWFLIMYMWARQYSVSDVAEEAEVTDHTAIDIYQWLREVCSTRLWYKSMSHYSGTSQRFYYLFSYTSAGVALYFSFFL